MTRLIFTPKYLQMFSCVINDPSRLESLIDAVQTLVLQEILKGNSFQLWNCYKVLALQGRYPWKIMEGAPRSLKELKGAPWFGNGQLFSASREQGLVERKLIEQALEGLVEQLIFVDRDGNGGLLKKVFIGAPNNISINSTCWRKANKTSSQMELDKDSCGVIWLGLILPFESKQIVEALSIIELAVKPYQFDPNIEIRFTSGRSIYVLLSIMYDRNVATEEQRAIKCHDKIFQIMTQKGYIPYRLDI